MRRLRLFVFGLAVAAVTGCSTGGACSCYEPADRAFRPIATAGPPSTTDMGLATHR
jgi:hypothetical protein